MIRKAYINGVIANPYFAQVDFFDRAYMLGDGIYEYILVYDGRIIDMELHLDRLYRSLDAVRIKFPTCRRVLRMKICELIRANQMKNGGLYLQISRGTAPRDHFFPQDSTPVLTMFVKPYKLDMNAMEKGVKVVSHQDFRWDRCDIKSISLIANCLAKQYAKDNGGHEVVFVGQDGLITEGGSSNIWIVDKQGTLRTHIADHEILNGITKLLIEKLAKAINCKIDFTPFALDEMIHAQEAFLTSTSQMGMPIIALDDKKIGDGMRGKITKLIQDAVWAHIESLPVMQF